MAIQVIAWVYDNCPQLSPTDKAVALSLAYHAHPDGRHAFPAIATVAAETGLSERTVRRSFRSLADLGVTAIQQEATHNRPAVYCFPGVSAAATSARGATVTPLDAARGAGRGDSVTSLDAARGDSVTPLAPIRGDSVTAGGASVTGRGDTQAGRGDSVTPEPSLTVTQPSEEPETSRVRDGGHLTILRDERADAESRGQDRAGGEDAFAIWERRHRANWERAVAGAGDMRPLAARYVAAG